jgi:hypothetical protein
MFQHSWLMMGRMDFIGVQKIQHLSSQTTVCHVWVDPLVYSLDHVKGIGRLRAEVIQEVNK